MSDFVKQLVKKWKGSCSHLSVGLCGVCAAAAIRETLEEAEKRLRKRAKNYEASGTVAAVLGEEAAAIAALMSDQNSWEKYLGVNERWYPVGGTHGMMRRPVTVVLVAGDIGDYAAYVGCGGKEHADDIARFGDKLSFEEAQCHFPCGLEKGKYRE